MLNVHHIVSCERAGPVQRIMYKNKNITLNLAMNVKAAVMEN